MKFPDPATAGPRVALSPLPDAPAARGTARGRYFDAVLAEAPRPARVGSVAPGAPVDPGPALRVALSNAAARLPEGPEVPGGAAEVAEMPDESALVGPESASAPAGQELATLLAGAPTAPAVAPSSESGEVVAAQGVAGKPAQGAGRQAAATAAVAGKSDQTIATDAAVPGPIPGKAGRASERQAAAPAAAAGKSEQAIATRTAVPGAVPGRSEEAIATQAVASGAVAGKAERVIATRAVAPEAVAGKAQRAVATQAVSSAEVAGEVEGTFAAEGVAPGAVAGRSEQAAAPQVAEPAAVLASGRVAPVASPAAGDVPLGQEVAPGAARSERGQRVERQLERSADAGSVMAAGAGVAPADVRAPTVAGDPGWAGAALQDAFAFEEAASAGWQLSIEPMADRGVPAGPAVPPPTISAGPVIAQINLAVSEASDRRVEIRLDPPELGRVQIQLMPTEHGVHATVLSQRPETNDLLRRHAEMLASELASAGYGEVSLEFAAGGESAQRRDPASEDWERLAAVVPATAAMSSAAGGTIASARPRQQTGGLDIRL